MGPGIIRGALIPVLSSTKRVVLHLKAAVPVLSSTRRVFLHLKAAAPVTVVSLMFLLVVPGRICTFAMCMKAERQPQPYGNFVNPP